MKPIKLIIQAFGSYIQRTEIDFTKFGDKGIYLITGDTGSGKTTIFDAIVFALYGNPSGENRDAKMIRSKYLDEKQNRDWETYAELEFEIKGKPYKIRRTPEYIRPAKRGTGETKQAASVLLTLPNKEAFSKIDDVNKKIEEIIGLSREQFVQIVMLPQGNFMKFLLSDTKEKQKIFNTLFDTKRYVEFQEEVKNEVNAVKKEIRDNRQKIGLEFSHIKCRENSAFAEERTRYVEESQKDDAYDYANALELIALVNEEYQTDLDKSSAELEKLEQELEQLTEDLTKAEETEKRKAEYQKTQKNILALEEYLKECQEKKTQAEQEYAKYFEDDFKMKQIQENLGLYDELDQIRQKQTELTQRISANKKNAEAVEKDLSKKQAELESCRTELQSMGDASAEILELTNKKRDLQEIQKQYNALSKKIQDYTSVEKMHQTAASKLQKSQNAYNVLDAEYNEKFNAFLLDQAGIMASDLEEGMPCPVCGSIHHPSLAVKSEQAPTEQEVEDSKAKREKAEQKCNDERVQVSEIKAKLETLKNEIDATLQELQLHGDSYMELSVYLDGQLKELQDSLKDVEKQIQEGEAKKKRKEELEQKIPKLEDAVKKNEKEQIDLKMEQVQLQSNLEHKNSEWEEKQKNLDYKSKKEAETVVVLYQKTLEQLKKNVDAVTEFFQNMQKEKITEEGKSASLKKQLKDAKTYDLDELKSKQIDLKSQKDAVSARKTVLFTNITTNVECKNKITGYANAIQKKEKKYQTIFTLADAINGQLNGQDKMTLEVFVQMKFFENIIQRANLHFLQFSSGQYELKRAEVGRNKTSKTGLDLNIIDHNNNTERDIKSLSGGEMFKASLALALGISDEIQSISGGVELETMFIDEGFGSLDEDTLGQAMNVLNKISENCTIGIISHVGALKQRVNNKIVVQKSRDNGSMVHIEY